MLPTCSNKCVADHLRYACASLIREDNDIASEFILSVVLEDIELDMQADPERTPGSSDESHGNNNALFGFDGPCGYEGIFVVESLDDCFCELQGLGNCYCLHKHSDCSKSKQNFHMRNYNAARLSL